MHPTQKPVGLFAKIIEEFSKEGETILDLFAGSGSTVIASEQTKRVAYLMEYEPHYCDVIISRWETFTGKTARLITPGEKVS
jgi:site-specific DNA-methyltransferase (adenine-specific)